MHRTFEDLCIEFAGIPFATVSGVAEFFGDGTVSRIEIAPIKLGCTRRLVFDFIALAGERSNLLRKYGPEYTICTRPDALAFRQKSALFTLISEQIERAHRTEVAGCYAAQINAALSNT